MPQPRGNPESPGAAAACRRAARQLQGAGGPARGGLQLQLIKSEVVFPESTAGATWPRTLNRGPWMAGLQISAVLVQRAHTHSNVQVPTPAITLTRNLLEAI